MLSVDPSVPGPTEWTPADDVEHDARFTGLWAVEQPFHALYEVTHYDFQADGTLVTLASWPGDCSGHLSQHCVTGSVANCVPDQNTWRCESGLTCLFGDRWHSLDHQTLVIEGECSDGVVRDIVLGFSPDASGNAAYGAEAVLETVDGDDAWSHDNWDWAFRKCAIDQDELACTSWM